jgi:preprotein translocase subunit SecD
MSRERIIAINSMPVDDEIQYYEIINSLTYNRTVEIKTNKKTYTLLTRPSYDITLKEINGMEDIGLSIYNAPTSNVKQGLDLAGGTRVLLRPETKLSDEQFNTLIENLKERLNVYGLSDIVVREANDLLGNKFILVEIAGIKKDEVKNLLGSQGKFEARIKDNVVFTGGDDMRFVCRTAQCYGIDPMQGCGIAADKSWVCRFRFSITLSPSAAQRQADGTRNLNIVQSGSDSYLSEKLDLYLDNELVDSLQIASDLKGKVATDIMITGAGNGALKDAATNDALLNMKRLQTILITGSLPSKLKVEQMVSISPSLGKSFIKNAFILALLALGGVSLMILLRYRNLNVSIPILFTLIAEIIMTIAISALIGQNLDMAAVAGLLIVIGTSTNDQIVITDEILRGSNEERIYSWKEKLKNAFFIVMGAYFTIVVAMIPLLRAGAGLLKGFAITTILGATVGVLITRPAFGKVAEILLKE